jgi:hypothetical protein
MLEGMAVAHAGLGPYRTAMTTCHNPSAVTSRERSNLEIRLRAEFAEMPGMKLTLPQASRFFNLEPEQCEGVMRELVRQGELSTDGRAFKSAGGTQWRRQA